jgi:WD40 repeat protein
MAYSPDGESLATYSWDGALRLWKTTTGATSTDLAAHTSPVTSIAFNPDGTLLASGGEDNAVRLWEVGTNRLLGILRGHNGRVSSLAFSPDGELLVSGGFDNQVVLWDILSGSQQRIFEGHENFVRCVAFSPDGKRIASGSTDQTVRLWDAATGEQKAVLSGHTGEIQGVAFSPDGAWLVSASTDFTLRFWEVATGKESGILKDHLSFALSAAFSPDGTVLASTSGDHSLRAWNLEFTPDGVVGTDHFTPIGHPGWVLSVAFSPDGVDHRFGEHLHYQLLGDARRDPPVFLRIRFSLSNLLRGHIKRVTSVAFSPDGRLLASGSADGSVRLWGNPARSFAAGLRAGDLAQYPHPLAFAQGLRQCLRQHSSDWDPFVGEWAAVDLRDGSNETLTITRDGDSYSVILLDDKATLCGSDASGKPQFGAEIKFTGTVHGTVLNTVSTSVTLPDHASQDDGERVLGRFFTYQSGT